MQANKDYDAAHELMVRLSCHHLRARVAVMSRVLGHRANPVPVGHTLWYKLSGSLDL